LFAATVKRSTSASTELSIPEILLRTFLRRANAITNVLIPMIILCAMLRFAEAAAVVFIVNIKSPVGICWADMRFAYAFADLLVPESSR
jgi:hypothetical protein